MTDCGCHFEAQNLEQKKVLVSLLLINAVMFFIEFGLGILSQSTALIADSLDMLADATVYGVGLYAVGKTLALKTRAAYVSGFVEIFLGLMVIIDISRRWIVGSDPDSIFMLSVGAAAFMANLWCLKLLAKHRDGEVHMRASWIFSKNDVIANLGTILAGVLVLMLDSRVPDLIIGCMIALLVIKGGLTIIKEAKAAANL